MTTPTESSPDIAFSWGEGSSFGQGVSESSWTSTLAAPTVNAWAEAQNQFRNRNRVLETSLADVKDGQNALRNRLELLEGSSGHGTMVMSHNWQIPHNAWVVLPFNTQLGPVKGLVASPEHQALVLQKRGLWRIDLLTNTKGYLQRTEITYNPTTKLWETKYYYKSISTAYMIEVIQGGSLLTARQFNNVGDNTETLAFANIDAPRSSHFSHTFVVDMPDESNPDQWAYVRASMIEDTQMTIMDQQVCWTHGGAARCALTASRWSQDVVNTSQPAYVPDGGEL